MAWIESHQPLERHPKTYELIRLMGWDAEDSPIKHVALDVAIGKLHRFWYWCLDFAPTGDLRGKNDCVIASSVGLGPNDAKRFVDAMVESCWIDRGKNIFRVHDWIHYAGRYLKESKFKKHPEKVDEMESVYRPRIVLGRTKVQDSTNQPTNQPKEPPPGFARFWDEWPSGHFRKNAKRQCASHWVRNDLEEKSAAILASLAAWKLSGQWQNPEYIPGPLPWLNQKKYETTPPPANNRIAKLAAEATGASHGS